jgi:RNA polymerase sigma-70 factor, ECF subfamily
VPVNGRVGVLPLADGRPAAHMAAVTVITVAGGRIVEIDILADRDRLARLDTPD